VDIKIKYSESEVKAFVLAKHQLRFLDPPDGEKWVAVESYGTYLVENRPITDPESTEAAK
jgi:hypothetical protein